MKHRWCALVAVLLGVPCYAQLNGSVRTESGLVRSVAGRDATLTVFKGIPYAEPPVENLRWRRLVLREVGREFVQLTISAMVAHKSFLSWISPRPKIASI